MNKKLYAWLVIGGAGYIGSHVARSLKKMELSYYSR